MGQITSTANAVYSDGPALNPSEPEKSEIRSLFATIDGALTSVVDGMVIGGAVVYSTRALLYADLAHLAGTLGVVYNDSTAAYNGVYVKSGGSGSGSWAITNLALPSTFAADLSQAISDIADLETSKLDNTTTALATLMGSAAGKTTPVDNDSFAARDSANGFSLTKFSWANIKATLKTYFDGLYWTNSIGTKKLLGRNTAGTGAAEQLAVGGGLVIDDALAQLRLEEAPEGTIKGRVAGGGTGTPINLTKAQALTNLGLQKINVRASSIAAAATIDLDAANGDFIPITGATTITAITLADGQSRWLRFTSFPKMTVSSTLVGNNAGEDLQFSTGDWAYVRADGSVRYVVQFPFNPGIPDEDAALLTVQKLNAAFLVGAGGRAIQISPDVRMRSKNELSAGAVSLKHVELASGQPASFAYVGESGRGVLITGGALDPLKSNENAVASDNLFSDAVYDEMDAQILTERKRLMSADMSALKRCTAGWRMVMRHGQSFENGDNIARLFFDALRTALGIFPLYAASIGPDARAFQDGTTYVTYGSDDREFWKLREHFLAGTGTDAVISDADYIAGNFPGNARGGFPGVMAAYVRQRLQRAWLEQDIDTPQTDVLDVIMSAAKGDASTADVYTNNGRSRTIDGIRVFKEAIANHVAADGIILPSAAAAKGLEVIHNLHGQAPNLINETGYKAAIEAYVSAFAAALADGTTGLGQPEPFAFTMMQPGNLFWANTVNTICDQMIDIMDDVTGASKYNFLIGAMWDTPSFRTLPIVAEFTASIAGTVMTVTGTPTGVIAVGDWIGTPGVQGGTKIVSLGTGTGGAGTYNVSVSQTMASQTVQTSKHPDAGNGHPLLAGNVYMGARQGIAEHFIIDRNQNFFLPKPLPGKKYGNRFAFPICAMFPGVHVSPICVGVEPTILDTLGVSIEKPDGTRANVTSIRIVPGHDIIEGTTTEDLADYTVGRTGRNEGAGTQYQGIVNLRDGMRMPDLEDHLKVPFTKDQMRAIAGFFDSPTNNGYGRPLEDIPGIVGKIDWGNPVAIRSFELTAL